MSKEELGTYLEKLFDKREYSKVTKDAYKRMLFKLYDHYPNKKLSELKFEDIDSYVKQLISRKKASPDSLKQLIAACIFIYNDILNRNYKFYKIKLPEVKRKEKEILTQEEVIKLIEHITNPKHKAIIATIYSCYLERSEVLNLRIDDVKSKKGIIHIKSNNSTPGRDAVLSGTLLRLLRDYLRKTDKRPKVYLFEGATEGRPYSATSLSKSIDKNVKECGIEKKVTPSSIRKSAIKHMVELGVPLYTLLIELGIFDMKTYNLYNEFCYENYKINFSPLDKIVVKPKIDEFDLLDIEQLVLKISDEEQKDYLKEAVSCLRSGALRAGVIFIWTAGIRLIQQKILDNYKLSEINKELKTIYPKAKDIKTIDDFAFVKDDFTIQLSNRLGLYDKNQKNELINSCLGLRNKCGHPSKYNPLPNKVKAYIEDMISMVFE